MRSPSSNVSQIAIDRAFCGAARGDRPSGDATPSLQPICHAPHCSHGEAGFKSSLDSMPGARVRHRAAARSMKVA